MATQPTGRKRGIPSGFKFPESGNPCRSSNELGNRWLWILALIAGLLFAALRQAPGVVSYAPVGEFGGDLGLLSSFCSHSMGTGESNYYIDMWAGRNLEQIVRAHGLTNNHALFINSHGKGGQGRAHDRFAFYPHAAAWQEKGKSQLFSIGDVAAVLGPESAAAVHNVYITACDLDRCFSASEIKSFFPNVTNVVHTPKGKAGYQAMFYEAIVNPSWQVQPLYETRVQAQSGKIDFEIGTEPTAGAKRLPPYVADLFLPAGKRPYATRVAGRELLSGTEAGVLHQGYKPKPGSELGIGGSRRE